MSNRTLPPVIWLIALAALACAAAPAAAKRARPVLNVVPKPAKGGTSATIGPKGGKLHVKTPNGTSATLLIPAGALARATRITLTPLAAVKRVPFKRRIAGAVRLGPEGLTLLRPGKLLLRPRKAVPKKLQTAFSASGAGRSFHIYPSKRGRVLTVPLLHFSIYGEGAATASERAGEASRQQSDAESTAERDLANAHGDKAIAAALKPWMQRVAAEVKAAASDDSHFLDALDHALSLAEELRLLGWSSSVLPPDMGDQLPASVAPRLRPLVTQISAYFPARILANALAEASGRCVTERDPAESFRILYIEQLRRQFGVSDEVDLSRLQKCLRFGLDLRAHLTEDQEGTYKQQATLDVGSTGAPLRLDPQTLTVAGNVPLTVTHWDWYDNICFQHGGAAKPTAPGHAAVTIEANTRVVRSPNGSSRLVTDPPKLSMELDPGQIDTESQCQVNTGGGLGAASGWYRQAIHAVYGDLQPSFSGPLTFTRFTSAPGDPYAKLEDARTVTTCMGSDDTCTGDVKLTLHHTPVR